MTPNTSSRCVVGTGALASCAAPLVGLLAELWFGFSGAASRSHSRERDQANAQALGSALLFFCLTPWIGTLIIYTGKHPPPLPPAPAGIAGGMRRTTVRTQHSAQSVLPAADEELFQLYLTQFEGGHHEFRVAVMSGMHWTYPRDRSRIVRIEATGKPEDRGFRPCDAGDAPGDDPERQRLRDPERQRLFGDIDAASEPEVSFQHLTITRPGKSSGTVCSCVAEM